MSSPFPLQPVLDLAREDADAATVRLGKAMQALMDADRKLKTLLDYRAEYQTRYRDSMASGLDSGCFANFHLFLGKLEAGIEAALERHAAPLVDGRRLKLRYMTQAKARPPTFIVFGTRAELTPEDYRRYLVNGLRDTFNLPGTPVRLQFRGTKNPYAED